MQPFLPSFELLGDRHAENSCLVVHGAFGSGQNLRGFTKKLCERCPTYAFALVDLRAHGASGSGPAPHTLATAASDLARLGSSGKLPPVRAVIGHSLGGKVALQLARSGELELQQVWALDSNPGAQNPELAHEIRRVVEAVRRVPLPIASRNTALLALEQAGLSKPLAQWMSTNLKRDGEHYRWTFDLDAVLALLADYFEQDLWPYLEAPKSLPDLHLVVAERSDRWSADMKERLSHLERLSHVKVHELADSGHWVHVDNPAGLLAILEVGLNATYRF